MYEIYYLKAGLLSKMYKHEIRWDEASGHCLYEASATTFTLL